MKNNPGMSETLGAVLMIVIFVAGFGILGVAYLSQPSPEKIPSVMFNLWVGNDSVIYLTHAGGDNLRTYDKHGRNAKTNAEYYILIDKTYPPWPIKDASESLNANEEQFSYYGKESEPNVEYLKPGEGFRVLPQYMPKEIDIVHKGQGGAERIIWSGLIPREIEFSGCGKVCLNVPIQFHDKSTGNVVYSEWDFDTNINPGIDSDELHPVWTYTTPGLYTVTHNIKTDEGLSFTLTKKDCINVKPVHADFHEKWDPDTCDPGDSSCDDCRTLYPGRPCAAEHLTVNFIDDSVCNPTEWTWEFGDGEISSEQNPTHVYGYDYSSHDGTEPIFYTPELTVKNDNGTNSLEKKDRIVLLGYTLIADFMYDLLAQDEDENSVVEFTDKSIAYPHSIKSWEWIFKDDKGNSDAYIGQNPPIREFPTGNHTVTLKVTNDWGKTATVTKPLKFPCPKNTAAFSAEPKGGLSPLFVNFTDHSYERENITTWRWSFGDGTYYYTSNKTNPNPPPHMYSRAGTFSASLTVENQCGQSFANASILVVSKEASISGKIWFDKDEDGVQGAGENGLAGWMIDLEERKSGIWETINSTISDVNGNYHFDIGGVSNSVFRIREHLPDPSIWRVTKSYGTYKDVVSDNILIYDKRHYENVDFGNNRLQISKISVPGAFIAKKTGGQGFYTDNYLFKYTSLAEAARYLDYNTSYDIKPRIVLYSNSPSPNGSFNPDPPGGYPLGYTSWGNSSFTLKLRKYNTYLKQVGKGAYFLDLWQYNDGTGWKNHYSGDSFTVPDNTTITSEQIRLIYYFHPENVFEFDKPDEGALIPYTKSYTVEAHMEGINENKDKAWLISPVEKDEKFSYDSTVGEYLVTKIDTRTFEGQTRLFTGKMELTDKTIIYCYANATIDWEPNTVSLNSITSDITYVKPNGQVKGNTTVKASIGGKWQLNSSAKLVVNNKDIIDMKLVTPGINSVVMAEFNPEPYAGRTVPVYVSVPHAKGPSYLKNSAPWNITVLSKLPLQANFTAYPWEGRTPHEVAFTDLSTGGANSWTWDFKDGETSTKQNPIHFFNSTGNYPVRLTVTNASLATSYIEKNINVTGKWHQASLLTNRATSLASGGVLNFISRGSGSTITVNNSSHMIPDGSVVDIRLNEVHNRGKIFMAGGITECNLTNVTLTIDGETMGSGTIDNIRIPDFENIHSTLSLTAGRSYSKWISFLWDRLPVTVSYRYDLMINDLMPTTERFMSLEFDQGQSYFEGMAGSYFLT